MRNRTTIRVGVIGFGTVGTGTVKVLLEHQREIERRLHRLRQPRIPQGVAPLIRAEYDWELG